MDSMETLEHVGRHCQDLEDEEREYFSKRPFFSLHSCHLSVAATRHRPLACGEANRT